MPSLYYVGRKETGITIKCNIFRLAPFVIISRDSIVIIAVKRQQSTNPYLLFRFPSDTILA